MSLTTRSSTPDVVKAVAIVAVVFAHVTLGLNKSGLVSNDFIVWSMPFYLWYMCAFFFVAGMFVERSLAREGATGFVRNKARDLGYPFVVWSVIFGLTQMLFANYTNRGSLAFGDFVVGILPWSAREHMWFLPALFAALGVTALAFRVGGQYWRYWLIAVGVVLLALAPYVPTQLQQMRFTIWLALGAALAARPRAKEWLTGVGSRYDWIVLGASLLAFFSITVLWVGPGRDFHDEPLSLFVAATIGIVAIFSLARLVAATDRFGGGIARIGQWSLYIYLTHVPVLAAVRIASSRILGIDNPLAIGASSLAICVAIGCAFGWASERGYVSWLFRLPRAAASRYESQRQAARMSSI